MLLTPSKNLTTRFEPLKKSPRKSTGKTENSPIKKVSSGQAKWKTKVFGQNPVPPHFPKNWMTNFELLQKSLKKVDRQTEVTPIQKVSPGLAKQETENFGRSSSGTVSAAA